MRFIHKEMITWLLNKNASPLISDNSGINPIMYAQDKINKESPSYQEIYDLMHRKAFPDLYKSGMPEHIRTLLSGHKWKMPADGQPLEITYSYDKGDLDLSTQIGRRINKIAKGVLMKGEALNPQQRRAVDEVIEHYSSLFNIKFIPASTPNNAQFIIRQTNIQAYNSTSSARTDYCVDNEGYITQVSISLDRVKQADPYKDFSDAPGQFIHSIRHEFGHGFGLIHPDPKYSVLHTIMSYNREGLVAGLHPETIMPHDYEALRTMVPVNPRYHAEDDIYTIKGSTPRLHMIVDQGGQNQLDAASWTGITEIDLTPGNFSTVGNHRFVIAPGTWIQKVKGGNNANRITDNDLDNTIDLGHATGNAEVKLTKGKDTVILSKNSSSKTKVIIEVASGNGEKHIHGFIPGRDNLAFTNCTEKPISDNDKFFHRITFKNLTVLLYGFSYTPIQQSLSNMSIAANSNQPDVMVQQACIPTNALSHVQQLQNRSISSSSAEDTEHMNMLLKYTGALLIQYGVPPEHLKPAVMGAINSGVASILPDGKTIQVKKVPANLSLADWGESGQKAAAIFTAFASTKLGLQINQASGTSRSLVP